MHLRFCLACSCIKWHTCINTRMCLAVYNGCLQSLNCWQKLQIALWLYGRVLHHISRTQIIFCTFRLSVFAQDDLNKLNRYLKRSHLGKVKQLNIKTSSKHAYRSFKTVIHLREINWYRLPGISICATMAAILKLSSVNIFKSYNWTDINLNRY